MELLDFTAKGFPASNDVYGKMFYYLRDLLVQFQIVSQRLELEIDLCCSWPLMLPLKLSVKPEEKFDRMELGEL